MFSHDCAQYETQIVYICMQKHGYFFNLHKWGRYSAGSKTWPRDQPPDLENKFMEKISLLLFQEEQVVYKLRNSEHLL